MFFSIANSASRRMIQYHILKRFNFMRAFMFFGRVSENREKTQILPEVFMSEANPSIGKEMRFSREL
jgi:hypothetical protein